MIVDCDWCGAPMGMLDVVETAWLRGRGLVWLCREPWCGHEVELPVRDTHERRFLRITWQNRLLTMLRLRTMQQWLRDDDEDWALGQAIWLDKGW